MSKGRTKSDDEFFDESIPFFLENGSKLQSICPDCVDTYNDHSLLKLVSITYWVGIFSPIAHKQLREKFGYDVVYIDSMAGCGVTSTKRAGDYLCGSCPSAFLSASKKKFPFDKVIGVEIDKDKAKALHERLCNLTDFSKVTVYNDDIMTVSSKIANGLKTNTVSYIVIDPQALQGMTWAGIKPLLECKGDAMITWFEGDAWRLKCAAEVISGNQSVQGQMARLDELFGKGRWQSANSAEELTTIFINRVLSECGKTNSASVRIDRIGGNYYKMVLFTGKFREAERLAKEWKINVERRINSAHGQDISTLLDVKANRIATLKDYQ